MTRNRALLAAAMAAVLVIAMMLVYRMGQLSQRRQSTSTDSVKTMEIEP